MQLKKYVWALAGEEHKGKLGRGHSPKQRLTPTVLRAPLGEVEVPSSLGARVWGRVAAALRALAAGGGHRASALVILVKLADTVGIHWYQPVGCGYLPTEIRAILKSPFTFVSVLGASSHLRGLGQTAFPQAEAV